MATVYKFAAGRMALRRLLQDRTLRFTPPNELNDPFECGLNLQGHVDSSVASAFAQMGGAIPEEDVRDMIGYIDRNVQLKRASMAVGVLSLSKVCDEPLLWAHYGQSHQGFAIGFDAKHPFFGKGNGRMAGGLQDVEYSRERYKVSATLEGRFLPAPDDDLMRGMLFTKASCWSYEQEVRLSAYLDHPEVSRPGSPRGVAEFPPDMVTEIVIGVRTPLHILREMYKLHATSSPHAVLRVAWTDPHRFCMNVRNAPERSLLEILRKGLPHR